MIRSFFGFWNPTEPQRESTPSTLRSAIEMLAVGMINVVGFTIARSFERRDPGLAILIRCLLGGASLFWLLTRCFPPAPVSRGSFFSHSSHSYHHHHHNQSSGVILQNIVHPPNAPPRVGPSLGRVVRSPAAPLSGGAFSPVQRASADSNLSSGAPLPITPAPVVMGSPSIGGGNTPPGGAHLSRPSSSGNPSFMAQRAAPNSSPPSLFRSGSLSPSSSSSSSGFPTSRQAASSHGSVPHNFGPSSARGPSSTSSSFPSVVRTAATS